MISYVTLVSESEEEIVLGLSGRTLSAETRAVPGDYYRKVS
jgi:hypothetical protein